LRAIGGVFRSQVAKAIAAVRCWGRTIGGTRLIIFCVGITIPVAANLGGRGWRTVLGTGVVIFILVASAVTAICQRSLWTAILGAILIIFGLITGSIAANGGADTLAKLCVEGFVGRAGNGQASISRELATAGIPVEELALSTGVFYAENAAIFGASALFSHVAIAIAAIPTDEDSTILGAAFGGFIIITDIIPTLA